MQSVPTIDEYDQPTVLCDTIIAKAPKGTRDQVHDAARREHITAAEFIRRAVQERLGRSIGELQGAR
ncbi:hypothetical protein [Xanthobacter versatilis]|uniref:hypothetical protein n=1 Tax=Xanthobacter autotrophicus (strain ATCC BAA-1158 / Py2) TaxID=78245 RepID=UPI003728F805